MKTVLVLSNLLTLTLASPLVGLLVQGQDRDNVFLGQSSCPISSPVSCHRTPPNPNTCCLEYPGGLLMQTQFWDSHPSTGPPNSWTVHGLWPDHCDATWEKKCDKTRIYPDIRGILNKNGAKETVAFMDKYWVDIRGDNNQFWAHEWGDHGTCMSTLKPKCFPSGSPKGVDVVAYFQTTVKLFKTLPTYDWLAKAGITPSKSREYTLEELTSALQSASGYEPALDCKRTVLKGISWYFNLRGSAMDGTFVPVDAPKAGSCPSSGITYPPK